jgi:ATP-dependent Clp protease protease subunit
MGSQKFDTPKNDDFNKFVETPWVCDITEETAVSFHDALMKQFEEDPFKPIVIHINSYGGEVDALFSMLDSMDAIRSMAPPEFKFFTVAKGKACSAGAVLLSYGDYRFATPHSRIMIHQVVGGLWGSQPSNEVEFSETSRMNSKLLQILRKRCKLKMSMKEFKEKLSHNLYFTPEKAKEFGLIDIIGYPKVIEQKMYEVRVVNGEPPKERESDASYRTKNSRTSKN